MLSQKNQLDLLIENSPKNISLRTTAKLLKIAPQKFNQLLADLGFIFKNKSS